MATFLLGIYIALIFIRPMDWWPPLYGFNLVTAAACGTLMVAFPRILNDHQRVWREVPELRWATLFLFTSTISWIYPTWFGGMSMAFQEFGKIILLYFLIVLLSRDARTFKLLLWLVLACVIWMSIHGMFQHHRGVGFGGQAPMWRANAETYQIVAFGIFNDPNDLCLVFIMAVPIFFSIYRAETNIGLRGIALASIPACVYAAWLTNSRGGIMGIFGMLAAYAVARTKGFRRYFIAAIAILLVSVLAPSRFAKGLTGGGRLIPWGDGIAQFKSYPLLGTGYKAFTDHASESKVAHNSFIHVLAEQGVVGYIPFVMLVYLTVLHMRRAINIKEQLAPANRIYLSGLFSSLAGYLTALYFLSRQYSHVLYIIMGLCTAAVMIVCRDPALHRKIIVEPYQQDKKRGFILGFSSIVFLYVTIKIGYALGVG